MATSWGIQWCTVGNRLSENDINSHNGIYMEYNKRKSRDATRSCLSWYVRQNMLGEKMAQHCHCEVQTRSLARIIKILGHVTATHLPELTNTCPPVISKTAASFQLGARYCVNSGNQTRWAVLLADTRFIPQDKNNIWQLISAWSGFQHTRTKDYHVLHHAALINASTYTIWLQLAISALKITDSKPYCGFPDETLQPWRWH